MEITAYHPFIQAVQESFGSKSWTPGELIKKAKPRNALAALSKKAPKEIRAGDLKKPIYELWDARVLELVPPKPKERHHYRIRLISDAASILPNEEAIEKAYHALKSETRMVNVYFNDLARRSGQPLSSVHAWALARAKKGEAELSEGDFSLALDEQRKACLHHGEKKFLLVGIFS